MPKSKSPSQQGIDLATRFRKEHLLGTEPIDDINGLMKLVDADFIVLELLSGLDALTLRDPTSGALTVGIGTSSNPYRQRFTVAHEIGHIMAGDITKDGAALLCDPTHPSETRANTFARCVLCGGTPYSVPDFVPGGALIGRRSALPGLPHCGSNPTLPGRAHFGAG